MATKAEQKRAREDRAAANRVLNRAVETSIDMYRATPELDDARLDVVEKSAHLFTAAIESAALLLGQVVVDDRTA